MIEQGEGSNPIPGGTEVVNVTLEMEFWKRWILKYIGEPHFYDLNSVYIKDEAYPEDPRWAEAKANLDAIYPEFKKAKKALEDRSYEIRNGIKTKSIAEQLKNEKGF